jgi:hypothetical protein
MRCFGLGVALLVVVVLVVVAATRPKRRCPACGEAIRQEARKCRYCGEWLDGRPGRAA